MSHTDEPTPKDFDLLMGLTLVNSQMGNVMFPNTVQKISNQADLRRQSNPCNVRPSSRGYGLKKSPSITSLPKQVGSNRSVSSLDDHHALKTLIADCSSKQENDAFDPVSRISPSLLQHFVNCRRKHCSNKTLKLFIGKSARIIRGKLLLLV